MAKHFIIFLLFLTTSISAYTVKQGDNLGKIARENHTTKKEIKILNNLPADSDLIKIGQELKLPHENMTLKPISNSHETHHPKPKPFSYSGKSSSKGCTKLVKAYPDYLKSCTDGYVVWKDSTKMRYDDHIKKTLKEKLVNADIEDMFVLPYLKGKQPNPSRDYDPGRYRNEKFFRKMYGNSSAEVRKHLTTIKWFGRNVRVTTVNNVHRALKAVERDLKKYPKLKKFLTPIGGTFTWRKIAGTRRLSVHSFGAAIDINVKYSAYWRWNKGKYKYHNRIPIEIVNVFEKYGFIWGGKWYHYDTMHFEYRPELLK